MWRALFLLVLVGIGAGQGQSVYTDQERHWSLKVPAGWQAAPAAAVDALNSDLERRLPSRNFEFVALFRPAQPIAGDPYLLVQYTPMSLAGASYAEIEQAFSATTPDSTISDAATAAMLRNAEVSTPQLDRATNRIFFDVSLQDPDGGQLRGRCVAHLAAHGAIQLNFYSSAESFAANLPDLQAFLAGFRIEPGYRFTPAVDAAQTSAWKRIGRRALVGAVIGGLAGLIIALLRRRSRQSAGS